MSNYSPPTRRVSEVIRDVTRSFGDESGIVLENEDIIRWINDAMDTITTRISVLKARAKILTTSGQKDYSLQQLNVHEIEAVHYNGLRLPSMSFVEAEQTLFRVDANADAMGNPAVWYLYDGTVYLWPVPEGDGYLDIYYSAKPQHVTSTGNAILPLPDKYYQLIVQYVLQEAHAMNEDWDASQRRQAQFDTNISTIGEEDRTEQHSTYTTVTIIDDF